MDIKIIIESFKKSQEETEKNLCILRGFIEKEDHLWKNYKKLNPAFFLNEKTINFLADSLQLVNNEEQISRYDLADIKKIYETLVQYYPDNIQYQEDLITFTYKVMNDEEKTLLLIDEAVKRMNIKRKYLRKVLNEIKNAKTDIF